MSMKKLNRAVLTALAAVGVVLAIFAVELIGTIRGIWNPTITMGVGFCLIGGYYTGTAVWKKLS